jgi:hypothetical protein
MRTINARESLTDREREEFEQQIQLSTLQGDYQLKLAELELTLRKTETRWTQIFRLPFAILSLPVRFLFGIGYIVHAARKATPSDKFWEYLRNL